MPLPIITTSGSRAVAELLAHAQEANVRARQADAEQRVLLLQENWRHLVVSYVGNIYRTPAVRQAIQRRIKRTYNVLQQIANRVCVAYKIQPVRQLEGARDDQREAFAALMRESRIATKAKTWERHTFACNVAITVPRVYESPAGLGPQLTYEMILPDRCEAYTSDNDPMGDPVMVAYTVKDGSDFTGQPLQSIVLDAEAWHYYDHRGNRIRSVPHGAGVFPGTVWRLEDPVDDWWSSHRGSGIVDATIEVAHLAARMDWVRHGQDRKREVLFAGDMPKIPTQIAGAEGPVEIPLPPDLARLDVFDLNTSIENHLAHIRAYLHQAAESIGVPSTLVDFDPSATSGEINAQQHAALADVRQSHIEWYRQAEHDSAWKTALVLRGMRHPSARLLPPDLVRESFAIDYPDLLYVEEPTTRLSNAKARVAQGLSSTFREYLREHPSITFAEAREQVLAMAREEGELNQFYITNNIPRDPDQRQKTIAQLQGQAGGEASGESRNEDAQNDDSDEPGRADSDRPDDDGDADAGG